MLHLEKMSSSLSVYVIEAQMINGFKKEIG